MHIDPKKIKDMLDSKQGEKIQLHISTCKFCQELTGFTGYMIELHMNEFENKEALK